MFLMYHHGKCGHNLGVGRVHNTGPKLSLIDLGTSSQVTAFES